MGGQGDDPTASRCGVPARLAFAASLVASAVLGDGAARAQAVFVDSFGSGTLSAPSGIALDSTGNVYVSDVSAGTVSIFTANGALASSFSAGTPFGIAIGNGGRIYVTDQSANNVGIYNSAGTALGTIGSAGGGQGQFASPAGIALATNGTLYVTDAAGNKVQVFDSNGTSLAQFGSLATLSSPQGIAIAGGTLYLVNNGTNTLRPFTNGGGTAGTAITLGAAPVGIAAGNIGNLYVANSGDNTISIVNSATNTVIGSFGAGQANIPAGIAVSQTGIIYVGNFGSSQIDRYFAPSEWVAAGTNDFSQLTLNQNLTLKSGYVLNVQAAGNGITTLNTGAALTVGAGSTFTSDQINFNGGTLKITAPSFNSSAFLNLNATMHVDTAAGSTVTLSGFINDFSPGSDSDLVKSGAGTLILSSGGNSYRDTIITGGTLQADCCSLGVGNVVLSNNARLVLDQTTFGAPGLFTGNISGNGSLRVQGSNFVELGGVNTYTGGTIVTDGADLVVGFFPISGSLPTTGPVQVSRGAAIEFTLGDATIGSLGDYNGTGGSIILDTPMTLTVGDATDTVFSGVISESSCGCGGGVSTLVKQGSGSLTLNGVNTYTGGTTITAGTLIVGDAAHPGASLASGVTLAGGTLQGHGSIFGAVINTSGTVRPGGSIGTLTVGSFSQGVGGTTAIELSPSAASRLAVTGAATLNGTLSFEPQAGLFYPKGTAYKVLTAGGGITGSYATVTSTLPGLVMQLNYQTSEIGALVATSNGTSLTPNAQTPNQRSIAGVLDAASRTSTDADFNALLTSLNTLPAAQQGHALDELNAEIRTASLTAGRTMLRGFLGSLAEELGRGLDLGGPGPQGAALVPIAGERPLLVWSRAYGSFGEIRGNANASSLTGHTAGMAVGIEGAIDRDTTAGVALGYGRSTYTLRATPQHSDLDSTGFAVYGERRFGAIFVDGAAAIGYDHDSSKRGVDFDGQSRQASSTSDGIQAGGAVTLGYRWRRGTLLVEPQANLTYSFVHLGGVTESNAGAANLAVDARSDHALQSILGVRVAQEYDTDGGVLTPELRLGWAHEFTDVTPQAAARFAVAPDAGSFSASGASTGNDGALIGVGISHASESGLMLYARYDADLHTHATNHAATVGVKFAW